jgi:glutathione S-transferase
MQVRLYVVAASHPCWAVKRALELKAIPFKRVEWPPSMHVPVQRLRFGQGTVPGLTVDDERIIGSRAIMRRLDGLVTEPRLYPVDAQARARVEEADRWGEEVFQALARRLTWWALRARPAAILSYAEDSNLPFPGFVTRALTPMIVPIEWRINDVNDETVRSDLGALPGHLDRIDGWIADGLLGGAPPNAADLQIGSSLALLRTKEDVRRAIAGRPCETLAEKWFSDFPGNVPAGTFPADWLPAPAQAA